MKPCPAGTEKQKRPQHHFATTAPSPRDENGWGGGNGRKNNSYPAPKISLRALILPGKIQAAAASHLPCFLNTMVLSCCIMGCLKDEDEIREKKAVLPPGQNKWSVINLALVVVKTKPQ